MSLSEEEWKVMRTYVFPEFERRHKITIKSYQIDSGQLATKLEALKLADKSEIDVFAQDNMNLSILVAKDLILDLSNYRKDIPHEVLPSLIEACTFDKKLLFMPLRPNVQITYYNEDAFKKYNLSPPMTWGELINASKLFKEKEGIGRILIKGYGGNSTATQLYELISQAGGNPYEFNDIGCIKAFSFLQRIAPYLSPESKRAKWDSTNDILARQEAYIAQNWPFGVMVLVKKYGLDFIKTYSGWQGPQGEIHVIGGDVIGIAKNTKNKKMALKFIYFMQSKTVQELLVTKLGWPSIRHDAYGQIPEWLRPYFSSVEKALEHGIFREQVTWWPVWSKYINEAFRSIVMENAPIEKTLKKYKAQFENAKTMWLSTTH